MLDCITPCTTDPCVSTDPIVCPCPPKNCNICEDSFPSSCVFITDKLMCSNGTFYIAADLTLNDAISGLICKINELETKVNFVINNCCSSVVCSLPTIESITE